MTFSLKNVVLRQFSDLISEYSLDLAEVSNSEVVLRKEAYTLHIFTDRDGANITYFDTSSRPVQGYNIFLYLSERRRNELVFAPTKTQADSFEGYVESELASLGRHLRRAGRDILSGEKNWLGSYSWPTITPGANIAALL